MEGYGRVSRTILHHLNVVLLVLPRRGGASLTILLFSGLELSACVCVLGGGGLLTPFFYLQIAKRRRLCGLVAMPGEEIIFIQHHQDIAVGRCFDLGRGGGGATFLFKILNTGLGA